jgi:hypothetical protein
MTLSLDRLVKAPTIRAVPAQGIRTSAKPSVGIAWGRVAVIVFCAAFWAAVGIGVYRLLH